MITVRVAGVPEPYNLPWHLARDKGHFASAGVDLQWHTVPEGTGRMCQMLREDALDMAVLVTEGAVRDILNGGSHRIVSTFVQSRLPWGVHVPASSALHHPRELKDVPFAISRLGSGSHIMAMLYAERLGRHPRAEELVVVHNMEGAAMRMRSGAPIIFLWETYVTSRYVDAGVMRRVDEVRGNWPGFVIVARKAFARMQPGAIREALAVLEHAVRGLDHSAHTVELVMRNAGFGQSLAEEWLRHVRWEVGRPEEGSLRALTAALKDLGLVPADASLAPTLL